MDCQCQMWNPFFLPEKQQWLDEIVFCALAEREAFWKVTFFCKHRGLWNLPKKELIICLLSQNSTFLHYAEVQRKTDSCSSGIAARAEWLSTRAELHQQAGVPRTLDLEPRRQKLSGSILLETRQFNRVLRALIKEICHIQILPLNLPADWGCCPKTVI